MKRWRLKNVVIRLIDKEKEKGELRESKGNLRESIVWDLKKKDWEKDRIEVGRIEILDEEIVEERSWLWFEKRIVNLKMGKNKILEKRMVDWGYRKEKKIKMKIGKVNVGIINLWWYIKEERRNLINGSGYVE